VLCLLHSLSTGLISGFICAMYRIPHLPEWDAQPQDEQSPESVVGNEWHGGAVCGKQLLRPLVCTATEQAVWATHSQLAGGDAHEPAAEDGGDNQRVCQPGKGTEG
jgi:hypothetical protein